MSLKMPYVSSIFCNILSWFAPIFVPQHQLALGFLSGYPSRFFFPLGPAQDIPITLPYARTARTQEKQGLKFIQWLSKGT